MNRRALKRAVLKHEQELPRSPWQKNTRGEMKGPRQSLSAVAMRRLMHKALRSSEPKGN